MMSNNKDIENPNGRSQCLKSDISELDNQDFVNRLLAATPPYLYATFSNNFYFSDVLRSLVQSRNNDNFRNIQFQQQIVKKSRKRTWNNSQHKLLDDISDSEKLSQDDKPLELTNKLTSDKYPHIAENIPGNSSEEQPECTNNYRLQSNIDIRSETSDSTLSSNNPVWYSSLYPSYGIDPFHFFIDLRVSGHIYDNNKNNPKNSTGCFDISNNKKLGSAFSVPIPKHDNQFSNNNAMNQISKNLIISAKHYDFNESKENIPHKPSSNKHNCNNFVDDKQCENIIDVEIIDAIKSKK